MPSLAQEQCTPISKDSAVVTDEEITALHLDVPMWETVKHDGGRQRIGAIAGALDAARAGDPAARRTVADNLAAYASLLYAHIAKENNVLFPLAERLLTEADKERLAAGFDRIEEQIGAAHEKYGAMAHELADSGR